MLGVRILTPGFHPSWYLSCLVVATGGGAHCDLRTPDLFVLLPRSAAVLLTLTFATAAQAQADLCQAIAHHLWSRIAVAPLQAPTPLAELMAAEPAAFRTDETVRASPGRSIADALVGHDAADPSLAQTLHDFPPAIATRFGNSDVWLLDRVDGTLRCHSILAVALPPGGVAHEIELPAKKDPTEWCALSALAAVTIDGSPALWIEHSGAYSGSIEKSELAIAALQGEVLAAPCSVTVDYAMTETATHAYCDGMDCVPLIRTAEILAMRLRHQETAESLGAGVIRDQMDRSAFDRTAGMVAADAQRTESAPGGLPPAAQFGTFADQVIFPLRLDDGALYVAKMGHGGVGWRMSADVLLALYRLRDDRVGPAAGVYVRAHRTGISEIAVH